MSSEESETIYDRIAKLEDEVAALRSEERLLRYDKALPLLNKYLELEPEADDADFILELIKSVREKSNQ